MNDKDEGSYETSEDDYVDNNKVAGEHVAEDWVEMYECVDLTSTGKPLWSVTAAMHPYHINLSFNNLQAIRNLGSITLIAP